MAVDVVDTATPARAVPRSSTRMSTARAWSSVPAIASAWPDPVRDQDREPLETDAASHRLDGVERAREVHPGGERAPRLRLGEHAERERRRAAGPRTRERDGPGPRETTGGQERIERGKARRDRPVGRGRCGSGARRDGGRDRCPDVGQREQCRRVRRETRGARRVWGNRRAGGNRERAEHLRRRPRSCRAPALPERGEDGGAFGMTVHRTPNDRTSVR